MLAHRIAVLAAAIAVLAAPATAFATNADGATPTATALIAAVAIVALVASGLLARHRVMRLARTARSRLAQLRARPGLRRGLARRQG